MEIKSELPLDEAIRQYLRDKTEKTLRERHELGLAVPNYDTTIEVNVMVSYGGHVSLSYGNVALSILEFLPLQGSEMFPDFYNLVLFLNMTESQDQTVTLIHSTPEEIAERLKGYEAEYGKDSFGVFRISKEKEEYVRSGKYRIDLEELIKTISERLQKGDREGSIFTTIRHEYDHASLVGRPLAERDSAILSAVNGAMEEARNEGNTNLFYSKIPDEDLREYLLMKIMLETGANIFSVVPYGMWQDFRRNPSPYSRKLKGLMESEPGVDVYEDLQDEMKKRSRSLFIGAYRKETARLKRAYETSRTINEFEAILSGINSL